MANEKSKFSTLKAKRVSWAGSLTRIDPMPENIYLSKPKGIHITNPRDSYVPPRKLELANPPEADLPTRVEENDVPALKAYIWSSGWGILFSVVIIVLSAALIALTSSNAVEGAAVWNLIVSILSIPIHVLAIYAWRLPNPPSQLTKIYQGAVTCLWTVDFIMWCALAGSKKEANMNAARHKSPIAYTEHTPQKIQTLMIWQLIFALIGFLAAIYGWYSLHQGSVQVSKASGSSTIRPSILLTQPSISAQKRAFLSSEYPNNRIEGAARVDSFNNEKKSEKALEAAPRTSQAEDFLGMAMKFSMDLGPRH